MKLTSKAKHRTPLQTHTHTSLGQFFKEINGSFLLTENLHQVFRPKACIYDEVKTGTRNVSAKNCQHRAF